MAITDRDMLVSCHIEKFKFCTISQIEKIFFKDQQRGYVIVARRLQEMEKANLIKIYHDNTTNKNIYIWNDSKLNPPTLHRLKVLDLYAELIYLGFDIEQFEIEKSWMNRKVRSDALVVFTFEGRRYRYFVEVQYSNHPHNLIKYDELYKSNEVQEYLKSEYYPKILFISDREYSEQLPTLTKVYQVNSHLDKLSKILL
jgi:hypothetical protein